MILHPATLAELSDALADANARGEKIEAVDSGAFNRILAHTPEDMTVTVEAGITLAELQKHLARHNQWLPIDPPRADQITIADLIDHDLSGPRRHGFGTIRNWLIGIRFALADGTVVSSGGKVVKNVAGYDVAKLIIGSRGTLGVTVEATFKLRPVPAREVFVEIKCDLLDKVDNLLGTVLDAELTPVVFDLHSSSFPSHLPSPTSHLTLVLGFSGTQEEVDWQTSQARTLGFIQPSSLAYEAEFWAASEPVTKLSVLPSKVVSVLSSLAAPCVARLGNGVIYHRGTGSPSQRPSGLMQRVKETFDPRLTLPAWPR